LVSYTKEGVNSWNYGERNERPKPSARTPIPPVFIVGRLLGRCLRFLSVMLHVGFCRLSPVMRRMMKVTMGSVGVVGRL
jgi:hypothetical protein